MFGIGAQEILIIGLLALVVFGPGKLPQMARDLGGFVQKARASVDEFKSELSFEERREDFRDSEEDRKLEYRGLEADHSSKKNRGSQEPKEGHAEDREPVENRQPEHTATG